MKSTKLGDGMSLIVFDQFDFDHDKIKKEKVEVKEVDPSKKSELQLLNLIMFFVMFIMNGLSQALLPTSLREIS